MTLKIIVLQSFHEKYNPYWFSYETLTKWNLWKELTSSSTVPRGNSLLLTLVSFMPCSTSSSWWIRRGIKVSCRTRFHIFIYGYSFGSFAVKIWQQLMLMGILGRCVAPESLYSENIVSGEISTNTSNSIPEIMVSIQDIHRSSKHFQFYVSFTITEWNCICLMNRMFLIFTFWNIFPVVKYYFW